MPLPSHGGSQDCGKPCPAGSAACVCICVHACTCVCGEGRRGAAEPAPFFCTGLQTALSLLGSLGSNGRRACAELCAELLACWGRIIRGSPSPGPSGAMPYMNSGLCLLQHAASVTAWIYGAIAAARASSPQVMCGRAATLFLLRGPTQRLVLGLAGSVRQLCFGRETSGAPPGCYFEPPRSHSRWHLEPGEP